MALKPITNNALTIEALLVEVCEILQLNPYTTVVYADLQSVLDLSTGISAYFHLTNAPEAFNTGTAVLLDADGKTISAGELLDAETLWYWIEMPELPSDFRIDLVRHLTQRDELSEHIAELSQVRWERLRNWTNSHV